MAEQEAPAGLGHRAAGVRLPGPLEPGLDKDSSLWIVAPGLVEQVGCIHTCQGLVLDYVGVIIGPDLFYRDGRIVTDATKRASSDQSVKGLKAMLKTEPERASALADAIVKHLPHAADAGHEELLRVLHRCGAGGVPAVEVAVWFADGLAV